MNHQILGALYNSNIWFCTNTLVALSQTCKSAFYFRKKLSELHYKYISTVYRRNLLQYSIIKHTKYCAYIWTENVLRYMHTGDRIKYNADCDNEYNEYYVNRFGYVSQSKYNVFVHFINGYYCSNKIIAPCCIVKKDHTTHTHDEDEYRECDWCKDHSLDEWCIFIYTINKNIFIHYNNYLAKLSYRERIDCQSQYYKIL